MPTRIKADDGIEARLAHHRGELERRLEELKTADAKEKQELRQEIDSLKEQIAADKKAKEEKEKAEGTGGTLVLPPEQVPQGQHHDEPKDTPASHSDTQGQPEKKSRWKRGW